MIAIIVVLLLLLTPIPTMAQSVDIPNIQSEIIQTKFTYNTLCYGSSTPVIYSPPNTAGTSRTYSTAECPQFGFFINGITTNNLNTDAIKDGSLIILNFPLQHLTTNIISNTSTGVFNTNISSFSNTNYKSKFYFTELSTTLNQINVDNTQKTTEDLLTVVLRANDASEYTNYYSSTEIRLNLGTQGNNPPLYSLYTVNNSAIAPFNIYFPNPKILILPPITETNYTAILNTINQSIQDLDIDVDMTTTNNLLTTIANSLVIIGSNQQTVSDNITDQLIANQTSTNAAINNQTNTIVNSITSLNGVVTNLPSNINLYIAAQTSSLNARMNANTQEIVTALGNIQIDTTSVEDKITNLQTSILNALNQQTQTLSGTTTTQEQSQFLSNKDNFNSNINSFSYANNSQLGNNLTSNINHITNEITSFGALIGTDMPHPSTTNRPGDFRRCRNSAVDINTPMSFRVGSIRIPMTNNFIDVIFFCPRQLFAKALGVTLTDTNVQNLYNMSAVQTWNSPYNLTKLAWAIIGFGYISVDLIKLFYKIIQPQQVITEINGL